MKPSAPGYADSTEAHLKRLRRIEGQVRGVARMVEQDVYCIDVPTQLSAATKALESLALLLLDKHLSHCVHDAAQQGGGQCPVGWWTSDREWLRVIDQRVVMDARRFGVVRLPA